MGLIKPANGVIFAEDRFETLFNSLSEKHWLKKAIKRTIENLKYNVFSGERIKKKLIPEEYVRKHDIDNLFWYPLPKSWRLVYSVVSNKFETLAVIMEYFDHKNYERRFKY